MDFSNQLVTIIVLSYNSSRFIIETLESIKNQSYKNIELIITDDYSKDNTVKICLDWLKNNNQFFRQTQLLTAKLNQGIPSNCNRGIAASGGKWIKFIAGDDILEQDAIKDLILKIKERQDILILTSKVQAFLDVFDEASFIELPGFSESDSFFELSASEQFFNLISQNFVCAPGTIINSDLLKTLSGFDESYPLIEDWPFWLKATSAGHKIHFLNKTTTFYRIHNSMTTKNPDRLHPDKVFDPRYYAITLFHNLERQGLNKQYNERIKAELWRFIKTPRFNLGRKLRAITMVPGCYLNRDS